MPLRMFQTRGKMSPGFSCLQMPSILALISRTLERPVQETSRQTLVFSSPRPVAARIAHRTLLTPSFFPMITVSELHVTISPSASGPSRFPGCILGFNSSQIRCRSGEWRSIRAADGFPLGNNMRSTFERIIWWEIEFCRNNESNSSSELLSPCSASTSRKALFNLYFLSLFENL